MDIESFERLDTVEGLLRLALEESRPLKWKIASLAWIFCRINSDGVELRGVGQILDDVLDELSALRAKVYQAQAWTAEVTAGTREEWAKAEKEKARQVVEHLSGQDEGCQ